jgi:hypothetical protein
MAGQTAEVQRIRERLQQLAACILSEPAGDRAPAEGLPLLSRLTDELLVVAADAVAQAATAAAQPVSARSRLRLLADVVAEARGARQRLERSLAFTVGTRLERQPKKVLGDCEAARAAAAAEREAAHAAVAADLAIAPGLDLELEQIDRKERRKLLEPTTEVYVGFWELDALLAPEAPATSPEAPPPPTPNTLAAPTITGPDVGAQLIYNELLQTRAALGAEIDESEDANRVCTTALNSTTALNREISRLTRELTDAYAEKIDNIKMDGKLRQVITLLQGELHAAHNDILESRSVAVRVADECLRIGYSACEQKLPPPPPLGSAKPDARGRGHQPGWAVRFYDKRCSEANVHSDAYAGYKDIAEADIDELLMRVR